MQSSKPMRGRVSIFIAVSSLFSALTAVLTYFLKVPSPTGGYTHIGDTMIYLASLLFGVKVGATVGLIGPVIADLVTGYPRWYVTIVAHGVQGAIAGIGQGKKTHFQVFLMILSGIVMSLTYFAVNVFVKGLSPALVSLARDVFGQTLISVALALLLLKPLERNVTVKKLSGMV
ncbi:MAG: ECF transporter S component [Thermofilaceae archaeon]